MASITQVLIWSWSMTGMTMTARGPLPQTVTGMGQPSPAPAPVVQIGTWSFSAPCANSRQEDKFEEAKPSPSRLNPPAVNLTHDFDPRPTNPSTAHAPRWLAKSASASSPVRVSPLALPCPALPCPVLLYLAMQRRRKRRALADTLPTTQALRGPTMA